MLRTLQGIVLGLIAQGAAHLLTTALLGVHVMPPSAWHLPAFAAGGLVCGTRARSAWAGLLVAAPYAALVILADVWIGPRLSAAAILWAVAGIVLAMAACGLLARYRRMAEHREASGSEPPPA